ncbi:hypothetical protein [Taibaiella soli]|nr:hypothetical protein [Taibaiella soli]
MKRHAATIIEAYYLALLQYQSNLLPTISNSYNHHNCFTRLHFIF